MPKNTCSFKESGEQAVLKFSLKMAPESGRAAHPAEENVLKRTKTGREEKEGRRNKSGIDCQLSADIQRHGITCRETKTADR